MGPFVYLYASFEITVLALDESVDVDVPDGNGSSALREQAAAENLALEVEHWDSLQEEIAIAGEEGSRINLFTDGSSQSGCCPSDVLLPQGVSTSDSYMMLV